MALPTHWDTPNPHTGGQVWCDDFGCMADRVTRDCQCLTCVDVRSDLTPAELAALPLDTPHATEVTPMAQYDGTLTPQQKAYNSLYRAAEEVGRRAGNDPKNYRRVGRKVQFVPSEYHKSLVTAMGDVMVERITVEEALGLLHTYDHDKERWGK